MRTNCKLFARRVSVVAVQGALVAMACMPIAYAADDEPTVADLTTPTKSLEVGVIDVDRNSAKFGEYNGLDKKGVKADVNFDMRGGGAYDSNDATRWRITGKDLGLETRELKADYGQQGGFRINFGYDELKHNRTDTFQTPYQGIGSNNLTLPANWRSPLYQTGSMGGTGTNVVGSQTYTPSASFFGLAATSYTSPLVVNSAIFCKTAAGGNITALPAQTSGATCAPNAAFGGAYTTPLAVNAANTAMLAQNLTDLNDFQTQKISIKRTKYDFNLSYEVDPKWGVTAGWRHEDKTGLQAKGTVMGQTSSPAALNLGAQGVGGEIAVVVPVMIDQRHNQYNLSLNYADDKSFGSLAYYGSYFKNNNPYTSIASPTATSVYNGITNTVYGPVGSTLSSEPDNAFNQIALTGGYNFTPKTKLVADASYSRNTQNASYILAPEVFATTTGPFAAGVLGAPANGSYVPTGSLNGLIVNKSFDLKLTDKSIDGLRLAAAYKYDDRKNKTPVNTYIYNDGSGPGTKFVSSNTGVFTYGVFDGATIPGVAAGTRIFNANIYANRPYSKRTNQINLDADYDITKGQAVKVGLDWKKDDRYCDGTWSDCSFADTAKETTLRAEYRFKPMEDLSGRIAYDRTQRRVDNYNANAWMSLVPALSATNVPTLVAQGWNGSVLQFLNTYGIGANGLPIPTAGNTAGTAVANPIAAIQANQQLTNIYNLLFGGTTGVAPGAGSGNGAINKAYLGSLNNMQNMNGMDIYTMANRNRDKVRGSFDWQATEKWSYQVGGSYGKDRYPDSAAGLTDTKTWGLNLDAAYAASEDMTVSAYYNYEDQRQQMASSQQANGSINALVPATTGVAYITATGATGFNGTVLGGCAASLTAPFAGATDYQKVQGNTKLDPCLNWTSDMRDKTNTIGLTLTKKGLLSGKFDLKGDVSYTASKSTNQVTGGSYATNPEAALLAGVPGLIFINNSALPDVNTKVISLRLNGTYKVDKSSSVKVGYTYTKLTTDDWTYQTTGALSSSGVPTTSGVLPTNEQAPAFKVQTVGVAYIYNFK